VFSQTQVAATTLHSWRLAFPRIPRVHTSGVYILRESYMRRPYHDAFHHPPPFLQCIYHRIMLFRSDGTLLYCNAPGMLMDALRLMRKGLPDSSKRPAPAAAASSASKAPPPPTVSAGVYSLEGETLRAEVAGERGKRLRWSMRVGTGDTEEGGETLESAEPLGDAARAAVGGGRGAAFGGSFDRLLVDSLVMSFRETDEELVSIDWQEDDERLDVEGLEGRLFRFVPVPWLG
jgi:hypothetical protein